MKFPWMQFFCGDWLKDPRLSLCSPATRGVWIDLLCAMHENNRVGELRGTHEQLARIARCLPVDLAHALTELQTTEAADVTERNSVVTVTNRRMKRESKGRIDNTLRQQRKRENDRCHASVTAHKSEVRVQSQNTEGEGARARDGSECFAERPSWGEWWAYLQTQSCLLPAEWFARDKFEAAESDNWNGKSNWKAYARRCKGWWEADGRPMTPKTKNATNGSHTGNQAPSVFNLTKIIEAKKARCDTLKNKHATETGLDTTWNNSKAREEFVKIRGEIKSLNAQLAGMA